MQTDYLTSDTATTALRSASGTHRPFRSSCCCDYLRGLPVKDAQRIQLGRGTAEYVSRRVCGRDLVVTSLRVAPRIAAHTVPDDDWVMLLMPLRWGSGYVVNGWESRPYDVFLIAGRDGLTTVADHRSNVGIGVRRSRLVTACAALAGLEREDIVLRDAVLQPGPDAGRRLHATFLGALEHPGGALGAEGRFAMPQALEDDLVSLLASQLLPWVRRTTEPDRLAVNALRVVRAATAATLRPSPPSVADLCESAGVSKRWLHKCFVEVLRTSPYRYIRLARLSQAREMLMTSGFAPALVKRVALEFGYVTSGRFAADYRAAFGENPSDTLRRARGAAALAPSA